jgi:acyl carrier protein
MADYGEQLDFLCTLIANYNRKGVALGENTGLTSDLGLSSLEVMELIEQIEDHYDISIPLNILPDVSTIGDLARKLTELRN